MKNSSQLFRLKFIETAMKLEIGHNCPFKVEMPGSKDGWREKDDKVSSFSVWLLVNVGISIINQ